MNRHHLRFTGPRKCLRLFGYAALTLAALGACSSDSIPGPYVPVPVARVDVVAGSSLVEVGTVLPVTATVTDGNSALIRDRAVAWTSSDTTIATVTSTGNLSAAVKGVGLGPVTISAVLEGKTGSVTLTTTPPRAPLPLVPWQGFIGTEAEGLVPISVLPEVTGSYPRAINDASQVVGTVAYGAVQHAFLWSRAEGMKDLGVLPGGTQSAATAINARGQVAGYSSNAAGEVRAFRWSATTGMLDLGVLPGGCVSSQASGINNNGDVVGSCIVTTSGTPAGITLPFRWTESRGMEDLGTFSKDRSAGASAINDEGQIVGSSSEVSWYDDSRAVLWTGVGNAVQLGTCPPSQCGGDASAINASGDVAGSMLGRAVVWPRGGSAVDLGGPGGGYSPATGINDFRQVVGVTYPTAPETAIRAFLWSESGGMRPLSMPGKAEVFVSAINNKGEIVGYAR